MKTLAPLDKFLADHATGQPKKKYSSPLQKYLAAHARARALGEEWTICNKCQEPKLRDDGYSWCPGCREQDRIRGRAYYQEHREEINARSLAWYHANKGPSYQERKAAKLEAMAEEGLTPCPRCHQPKDMYDGYYQCEACRKYAREYKARKAAGK